MQSQGYARSASALRILAREHHQRRLKLDSGGAGSRLADAYTSSEAVDLNWPELNGKLRLEGIGDRLFEIVTRTRDEVVMGPMSDPAEGRLKAGVTRYFMAVAWIAADAEVARHKLQGDKPNAFMHAFLQQMHQEVRRLQVAIEPGCTDNEIWRMLFADADLYSRALQAARTQRCEDVPLAAGLRWLDTRSLFNLASAEAYGECFAVLTIGSTIPPQIVAVFERTPIDGTGSS